MACKWTDNELNTDIYEAYTEQWQANGTAEGKDYCYDLPTHVYE